MIQFKYNIGDLVWLLLDNKVQEVEVIGRYCREGSYFDKKDEIIPFEDNGKPLYYIAGDFKRVYKETTLKSSKKELLNSL